MVKRVAVLVLGLLLAMLVDLPVGGVSAAPDGVATTPAPDGVATPPTASP